MNAIKYIGMDVHSATISIAVLDVNGKLMMEVTIATQAGALLDFIRGLSGTLYVTFEEARRRTGFTPCWSHRSPKW